MQLLKTFFLLIFCTSLSAQINVISIDGNAYYLKKSESENQYIELSYGPLTNADEIILKENTAVTLINEQDHICALTEGEYAISALKFNEKENQSTFSRFCDYFTSFFMHHSAPESKKLYTNNIYAISRGRNQAPTLDLPLEGEISLDYGYLPFAWTHSCDTCEYIFTINKLESKDIVFSTMTSQKSFNLENPEKYLKSNIDYYWSVKTSGEDIEYDHRVITPMEHKKMKAALDSLTVEASQFNLQDSTASLIYVLGKLESQEKYNEAIQYGLSQRSEGNTKKIDKVIENFIYDLVTRENIDF